MRLIRLASEIDFDGWRRAARLLVKESVPPENIEWVAGRADRLLGEEVHEADTPPLSERFKVPKAFVTLARSAILNRDLQRLGLLYRLLWRIQAEPRLMEVASDPDVVRARALSDAAQREIHKIHAFVRFRQVMAVTGPVFIAWFEPTHHTLEAAASFFVRRFAPMRWSIFAPRVSVHWDTKALRLGQGAERSDTPDHDPLENLWRTYYASIFNPARLKTRSMQAHMPRKYWRNLPEAELIGELVARSPHTTREMIHQAPTQANLRAPRLVRPQRREESGRIEGLRDDARRCTTCPLHAAATQTVFGEGPMTATIMFVGEQPGDQEDLAGRPFVGPAGRVFDRALGEAGIDRGGVYVTNAVKHFSFELRGKRRLHKTPAQREIEACRHWLEQEIILIDPKLIVALGATAARSILGEATTIQGARGQLIRVSDRTQVFVTVHPSYLLRVSAERRAAEYARFVQELRFVASAMTSVDTQPLPPAMPAERLEEEPAASR